MPRSSPPPARRTGVAHPACRAGSSTMGSDDGSTPDGDRRAARARSARNLARHHARRRRRRGGPGGRRRPHRHLPHQGRHGPLPHARGHVGQRRGVLLGCPHLRRAGLLRLGEARPVVDPAALRAGEPRLLGPARARPGQRAGPVGCPRRTRLRPAAHRVLRAHPVRGRHRHGGLAVLPVRRPRVLGPPGLAELPRRAGPRPADRRGHGRPDGARRRAVVAVEDLDQPLRERGRGRVPPVGAHHRRGRAAGAAPPAPLGRQRAHAAAATLPPGRGGRDRRGVHRDPPAARGLGQPHLLVRRPGSGCASWWPR